jgi:hypothetical protein
MSKVVSYARLVITAAPRTILLRGTIRTYMLLWRRGSYCRRSIFLLVMKPSRVPSNFYPLGLEGDLKHQRMHLITGFLTPGRRWRELGEWLLNDGEFSGVSSVFLLIGGPW